MDGCVSMLWTSSHPVFASAMLSKYWRVDFSDEFVCAVALKKCLPAFWFSSQSFSIDHKQHGPLQVACCLTYVRWPLEGTFLTVVIYHQCISEMALSMYRRGHSWHLPYVPSIWEPMWINWVILNWTLRCSIVYIVVFQCRVKVKVGGKLKHIHILHIFECQI